MQGTECQSTKPESMKAEVWEGTCLKLYKKVIYSNGNNKNEEKENH